MTDTTANGFRSTRSTGSSHKSWSSDPKNQLIAIGAFLTVAILALILIFGLWPRPQWRATSMPTVSYTVQRGDTLYKIASRYPGMVPMDLALMNDDSQRASYPAVCTHVAEQRIQQWPLPASRGDFCNPALRLFWHDTLVPGATLRLPASTSASTPATELVAKMGSGNIALLIDGTNRLVFQANLDAAVAMHMAMTHQRKHLVAIWVYTPNSLFEYSNGSHAIPMGGKYAGLTGALNVLKVQSDADLAQIALVTAETGKSWDLGLMDGKPVFGLCTTRSCFGPMANLAKKTRGQRG